MKEITKLTTPFNNKMKNDIKKIETINFCEKLKNRLSNVMLWKKITRFLLVFRFFHEKKFSGC